MPVITVCGAIRADELGVTAAHEHVFCDYSMYRVEPPAPITAFMREQGISLEDGVTLRNYGLLMRDPQWSADNLVLADYEDALEEMAILKRAGVNAVVDPTDIGVGRDPQKLRRLSQALGMHFVTATGYYMAKSHPPEVDSMSVEDLYQLMLREVTVGIDGTGIRAGVMGELGTTGACILPNERKVLISAARVNKETNVPIMVHAGGRDASLDALRILKENGANLEKVNICHVLRGDHWREIAATGAYVGVDCLGSNFTTDSEQWMYENDMQMIEHIKRILDGGCGHKVLIGNDICMKMRLHKYGGWGYDHIQTNLVAYMHKAGITDEQLHTLQVENPAHFLDTDQ